MSGQVKRMVVLLVDLLLLFGVLFLFAAMNPNHVSVRWELSHVVYVVIMLAYTLHTYIHTLYVHRLHC